MYGLIFEKHRKVFLLRIDFLLTMKTLPFERLFKNI